MSCEYMKWQSTSLVIKEMPIKTMIHIVLLEDEVEVLFPIPPAKNR